MTELAGVGMERAIAFVRRLAAVRIERFLARRGHGQDEDDRGRAGDDEAARNNAQIMLQVHSLTAPVQREAEGLPKNVVRRILWHDARCLLSPCRAGEA